MTHALRNSDLITVITNSLRTIDRLQGSTQITQTCPGGTLSVEGMSAITDGDLVLADQIAVSTLRTFRPKNAPHSGLPYIGGARETTHIVPLGGSNDNQVLVRPGA